MIAEITKRNTRLKRVGYLRASYGGKDCRRPNPVMYGKKLDQQLASWFPVSEHFVVAGGVQITAPFAFYRFEKSFRQRERGMYLECPVKEAFQSNQ